MKKFVTFVVFAGLAGLAFALPVAGSEGDERRDGGNAGEVKQEWSERRNARERERQAFRASLEGKTPREKAEARKAFNEKEYREFKALNLKRHLETMGALRKHLAGDSKLSEAEKQVFESQFEQRYRDNSAFQDRQHAEAVAFFDKITGDPRLTREQKKAGFQAFQEEQKRKARAFVAARKRAEATGKAKARSWVESPLSTGLDK